MLNTFQRRPKGLSLTITHISSVVSHFILSHTNLNHLGHPLSCKKYPEKILIQQLRGVEGKASFYRLHLYRLEQYFYIGYFLFFLTWNSYINLHTFISARHSSSVSAGWATLVHLYLVFKITQDRIIRKIYKILKNLVNQKLFFKKYIKNWLNIFLLNLLKYEKKNYLWFGSPINS